MSKLWLRSPRPGGQQAKDSVECNGAPNAKRSAPFHSCIRCPYRLLLGGKALNVIDVYQLV